MSKWNKIIHLWYKLNDIRQEYVQYAYDIWWLDLVLLMECENGMWNISTKWDWWHAIWLCQINDIYHDIPKMYYTDRRFQIEYCAQKMKQWTPFYWSTRNIKWQRCSDYVKDRFVMK